ncbi:MAG: ketoacyl-ACP synthase III [Mesorhizobium sp.]|nr:ketoacyl-ACP synthase III [Mesorhizobium sp.]
MNFKIAGSGIALPARRISSSDLDAGLCQPAGTLFAACGVAARYVCSDETQEDLATQAARAALAAAELQAHQIDLVIFAAAVTRQPIPSTAPLVVRKLGIAPGVCTAFDINSTCLSFLSGFDVAVGMLATGRFRAALVISAEIASRALPWSKEPEIAGLFGDGAAAVVLVPVPEGSDGSRLRAALFETYPEGYEFCQLAAGGTGIDFHLEPDRFRAAALFHMDGHNLFKLTAKYFPSFVERTLERAGWRQSDVDLVVPHQASPMALAHLVKRCGFSVEQVVNIVADYGNQVAASIPTALHLALQSGRLPGGAKLLVLGTSAGVSFGGMAIEL